MPKLNSKTLGTGAPQGRPVRLKTADGVEIGGVFYEARRPRSYPRAAILHCGGGIPAARYRRFADFLSEFGIPVLTYDYRGIGSSRPAQLRGFAAGLEDWVEYDSAAAIAWLRELFPGDEIIGISHSIGALALGGAPNAAEQDRLVLIAPHTGYVGDYAPLYRLPMGLAWHAIMPVLTWTFGYFPGSRLRLGSDLPGRFALQWAGRLSPGVRMAGPGGRGERMRKLLGNCAALERPAQLVTVSDDAFATVAGARRLLSYLPRLSARHIVFTPADAGTDRLGHFGFFSQQRGQTLWPRLLANLGQQFMPQP
jgi:predicted alpha/beta hydrolase